MTQPERQTNRHAFKASSPASRSKAWQRVCRVWVALLLLFVFTAGCERCQSSPVVSPTGQLVVVTDESLAPSLRVFSDTFNRVALDQTVTVVEADPAKLAEIEATPGAADMLIVAGARHVGRLLNAKKLSGTANPWIATPVELVARADQPHRLRVPAHLLQPVFKGLGLPVESDPVGRSARAVLRQWNLETRLAGKLVDRPSARAARESLVAGEVDLAFMTRLERLQARGLEPQLADSRRPETRIVYYLVIPADAKNPAVAQSFRRYLAGSDVVSMALSMGFEKPPAPSN